MYNHEKQLFLLDDDTTITMLSDLPHLILVTTLRQKHDFVTLDILWNHFTPELSYG